MIIHLDKEYTTKDGRIIRLSDYNYSRLTQWIVYERDVDGRKWTQIYRSFYRTEAEMFMRVRIG